MRLAISFTFPEEPTQRGRSSRSSPWWAQASATFPSSTPVILQSIRPLCRRGSQADLVPGHQLSTSGGGVGATFVVAFSAPPFVTGDWIFIQNATGMTGINGRTVVLT